MHRVKAAQCQQAQPFRIHFRASIRMGVQATALRNLIERSRGLYTGVLTHLPCLAGRMPGGHTRATGLDVRQSWARMNLGGQYLLLLTPCPITHPAKKKDQRRDPSFLRPLQLSSHIFSSSSNFYRSSRSLSCRCGAIFRLWEHLIGQPDGRFYHAPASTAQGYNQATLLHWTKNTHTTLSTPVSRYFTVTPY
ncbi:hypothetical protein BofuT4_P063520.1 [Botrytis cinerea T4]|uniref:Uncharacterized protein n=1 Tax=Botryotinia fuckeliana (strain T4) TaxID=999810 RepID=G2XSW9_BOTF4|nr:hypothetical protein BofuT4_P063520.1 [Botrytis cinerea T4]